MDQPIGSMSDGVALELRCRNVETKHPEMISDLFLKIPAKRRSGQTLSLRTIQGIDGGPEDFYGNSLLNETEATLWFQKITNNRKRFYGRLTAFHHLRIQSANSSIFHLTAAAVLD